MRCWHCWVCSRSGFYGDNIITSGKEGYFLGVSFASTDYVGHLFCPSSLESEDNILRLDRILADLFTFIEKNVGLKNTLIVLSADHGSPEVPDYLKELGIEAGYVEPKSWDKQPALAVLKKQFGIDKELIFWFYRLVVDGGEKRLPAIFFQYFK